MMAKENRISNKEKRHNDRDTQVVANENAIKYFKQKGGGGGCGVGSVGCC